MNQYLSATLSKINKYENIGMYYKKQYQSSFMCLFMFQFYEKFKCCLMKGYICLLALLL
jgi:hypothetical protein